MVGLLGQIPSGKVAVSVGGLPLIAVDADRKTLDVEAERASALGLRFSDLVRLEGRTGRVRSSLHMGRELSRLGWKLSVYEGRDRVVSLGSGVSRLTGHVSPNPLRLKKLLELLK